MEQFKNENKGMMKVIRQHEFGGPEVLCYEDTPIPEMKSGEILVRVKAIGMNPPDWYLRDGCCHLNGSLKLLSQ